MKIFFIRHAESENNKNWFFHRDNTGRLNDPYLSDLGQQQVGCLTSFLSEHLEEFDFTRMYISPFLRTLQTAAAFEHLYDIPKTVWTPIHEGGACFEIDEETNEHIGTPGMGRTEILAKFPNFSVSEEIDDEGWWKGPGSEPRYTRSYRANLVLTHLIEEFGNTNEHIALVSHGGFHNHFINAILGLSRPNGYWFEAQNTAITCCVYGPERGNGFNPNEWRIEYTNRSEWLPKTAQRDWFGYS